MPISGNALGIGIGAPPKDTGPSIEEAIQDAQSRSLDFPAAERSLYIRTMVKRVQELQASGRTAYQIQQQVPEFHRDFPYLFEMITEHEDFDKASLQTMLTMLDRMGDNSLNHHQATVIVGQRLAKKYIRPGSSSPP